MMKNIVMTVCVLTAYITVAWAARYPILGGPGLIHVQSAKIGPSFGYRTVNLLTYYGDLPYLQDRRIPGASCIDAWTHQLVSYSPHPNVAVLAALTVHGNKWSLTTQPPQPVDLTMSSVGDAVLSAKYHRSALGKKIDFGVEPMLSIPLGNKGTDANGKRIVIDMASNTGRPDFGGKLLADYNIDQLALLVNAGILTRGEQRVQIPLGAGAECGFTQILSGFCEFSGELRAGAATDNTPDTLVPRGIGYDRSEFRIGAGVRLMPLPLVQVSVAADIGLTRASAPWQIIVGIDLPATAGRIRGGAIPGAIAGLIKDRDNGVPMKGMITFPGADVPGTVSDDVGNYVRQLPPGEYTIHIYANGYRWLQRKISVEPGRKLRWDLTLKRKLGTINGKAFDARTLSPLRATAHFTGTSLPTIAADTLTGEFTAVLPPGKYAMSVTADGYRPREFAFTVKDQQALEQPVSMEPAAAPASSAAPLTTPPSAVKSEAVRPELILNAPGLVPASPAGAVKP